MTFTAVNVNERNTDCVFLFQLNEGMVGSRPSHFKQLRFKCARPGLTAATLWCLPWRAHRLKPFSSHAFAHQRVMLRF